MPLSDVIRTAVSEIERYDRVDLALQADPPMVGHVALTTAHLLAELLENATQFSNPDTRVISSTAFSPRGVRITITDLGLGMTWDEINEANQRISSPPATEVVGSQRLGFYVVGRLARRLDAAVELKPGRAQGTVVTIDLPPALFVTGTVVQSTPPLEPVSAGDAAPDAPASPEGGTSDRSTSTSGLPTRGGSAPAAPHPTPSAPPVAPAPSGANGLDAGLPRRSAGAAAAPVASTVTPSPAPVASDDTAQAPRSGMFSSFRSRRAVESEAGAVAPLEATSLDALAQELPEFVPTLDTATPALPHRSETAGASGLRRRGSVEPDASTDDAVPAVPELSDVTDEDAVTDEVATADPVGVSELEAPVEDADLVVPDLAADLDPLVDRAPSELTGTLPAFAIDPLDDAWEPTLTASDLPLVAPTDLPADQPLVALLAPEPDPIADVPSLHPAEALTDQPTQSERQSELEPQTVGATTVPAVDDLQAGSQARSTLSELARETSEPAALPAVEEPDEAPAAQAAPPAPVAPPVPVVPVGAPAMDILPSKPSGRGLHLRRSSRPKTSHGRGGAAARLLQTPVAPAPRSPEPPAYNPAHDPALNPAPNPVPVPAQSVAPAPLFDTPAPEIHEPTPVQAAPSSLFAPPPVEDLPAATPTPAFPAASVPALVAAQSLRERSAMASEALSELSALSTYRPESVSGAAAPASLVRRTPRATPAALIAEPQEPQGQRRANRNAADVRSMLSGFRAGVERGRTSPGVAPGGTARPYPEVRDAGDES
jgi:hypothetical protein